MLQPLLTSFAEALAPLIFLGYNSAFTLDVVVHCNTVEVETIEHL